jgi:Saxitoxin biosynthesis operon protein SxtJ
LNDRATVAELRNFGLLVGAIFAGLFGVIAPWAHHLRVPIWPWAVGLTLVMCGIFAPALLRYPYLIWCRLGRALGWVNSQIVLNLLFFLIFLPAAVVARLARWDPMKRAFVSDQPSYRIRSESASPNSMERPY